MPKQKKTSHGAVSPSSISRPNTISSLSSLKELKQLVPAHFQPTRVWAEKIKRFWPDAFSAPPQLIDVIYLLLPPKLYDAVSDSTFTSHIALLDKVCQLDGPTRAQATEIILHAKADLQPDRHLRETFHELKRHASTAFPDHSTEEITAMAWAKIIAALPTNMQQTLSLAPQQPANADTLDALDRAFKLQCADSGMHKISAVTSHEDDSTRILSSICARLDTIESSLQHAHAVQRRQQSSSMYHSNNMCWCHHKFGLKAQKCLPPCSFKARKPLNFPGAPSPQ
jgi:hypothetical protein